MSENKDKYLITFGGWYQRTTLHMSEIYAFLDNITTRLDLSIPKLKKLHESLEIVEVKRELSYFEYVYAKTKGGIEFRYYEDGLYIFEKHSDNIEETRKELNEYFDKKFNPAIEYLFSLGAPTPKILADIKISHVAAIACIRENPDHFQLDEEIYGKIYSKLSSGDVTVYKTINYIFVVTKENTPQVRELIETQVFFREFKDQLDRYLNIHRTIWERISEIKEQGTIRGYEVATMRSRLDNYQKTISLINNRINQMGSYASTRRSIAQKAEIEDHLSTLFQFRFEALFDTLEYIKQIWSMTLDYLNQAMGLINDIKNSSLNNGITSVRALMTLGIVGMVAGMMTTTQYPKLGAKGLTYFIILMTVTIGIDFGIKGYYRLVGYKLKFTEREKEFKTRK